MEVYIFLLIYTLFFLFTLRNLDNTRHIVTLKFFNEYMRVDGIIFVIVCVPYFIFSLARDRTVGTDLSNYVYMLGRIDSLGLKQYIAFYKLEPFFSFFEYILVHVFYEQYELAFTVITSFFVIFLFGKSIWKMSSSIVLSLFLFLTFGFYNQSLNIIRQYIAAGFVLLAIYYLKDNNKEKYWLITLVATLIHSTAIISIIYFIVYRRKEKSVTYSIVAFGGLALLSLIPGNIMFAIAELTSYGKYLARDYEGEIGIGLLINMLLFVLFVIFRTQFKEYDEMYPIWIFMCALTLGINFFLLKLSLVGRFMGYTKIGYIISIPSFVNSFRIKSTRVGIWFLVVALFIIYYLYAITHGTMYQTIPYSSELLGIISKGQ